RHAVNPAAAQNCQSFLSRPPPGPSRGCPTGSTNPLISRLPLNKPAVDKPLLEKSQSSDQGRARFWPINCSATSRKESVSHNHRKCPHSYDNLATGKSADEVDKNGAHLCASPSELDARRAGGYAGCASTPRLAVAGLIGPWSMSSPRRGLAGEACLPGAGAHHRLQIWPTVSAWGHRT